MVMVLYHICTQEKRGICEQVGENPKKNQGFRRGMDTEPAGWTQAEKSASAPWASPLGTLARESCRTGKHLVY